jgi:predicted dehydrogenase
MMKVAIVGCGKVADQHAVQIQRIPNTKIVGVCDTELLMARQMCDRFRAGRHFTDVGEMLETVKPDVVHVTTPPQSHFAVGKRCLEAGSSVYIEKPFTLSAHDADDLIALARRKGVKLTAGHNAQFTHAMVRMRELVRSGYLGGQPVHMESIYCYDLGGPSYAQALLGDADHWVRRLPGSLLQNIISHGISKIAEFMCDERPLVLADGFTSPFLKGLGQTDIIDELRVIIRDSNSTTAHFTFSSQMRPSIHQFRVYGPKRSLVVDDDHQLLLRWSDKEYKSYTRFFVPPVQFAKQYLTNLAGNGRRFLGNDFHMPFDAGLKRLVESFYRSISHDTALPISYREIMITARIMDDTFAQLKECNQSRKAVLTA